MHGIILFIIISLTLPASVLGEHTSTIISELEKNDPLTDARNYFDAGEEQKALDIYLSVLQRDPQNYTAFWNTSLIYTRKARRQTTYDAQEALYRTARSYAQRSLDAHPNRPRSHYVFALASAGLADDMPNSSERVQLIWDMKEHGERALRMDPGYAPAWHLVGVWHSKIGSISRAERLGARLVYGALPDGASHTTAEQYLQRAIQMDPGVILFRLDLAQHYQETGQPRKAVPILQEVLRMQPVSQNDELDLQEARERYQQVR